MQVNKVITLASAAVDHPPAWPVRPAPHFNCFASFRRRETASLSSPWFISRLFATSIQLLAVQRDIPHYLTPGALSALSPKDSLFETPYFPQIVNTRVRLLLLCRVCSAVQSYPFRAPGYDTLTANNLG
jgi:hypothetical protein